MSASGMRERLGTAAGVIEYAASIDIKITPEQAEKCTVPPPPDRPSASSSLLWLEHPHAVSTGPITFVKNRLREVVGSDGLAEDDSLPLIFKRGRGKRTYLEICPVARSKMFNTPLYVYPIDLTALIVSGGHRNRSK